MAGCAACLQFASRLSAEISMAGEHSATREYGPYYAVLESEQAIAAKLGNTSRTRCPLT